MNMKTSFIAAAVALATVYSFSVSAVQKDITVTANIDSTLELLQADGSSLPSTMKLDFMPGTLTTQPFNIREKRSGEYQGTLTVTMLMGTQTP